MLDGRQTSVGRPCSLRHTYWYLPTHALAPHTHPPIILASPGLLLLGAHPALEKRETKPWAALRTLQLLTNAVPAAATDPAPAPSAAAGCKPSREVRRAKASVKRAEDLGHGDRLLDILAGLGTDLHSTSALGPSSEAATLLLRREVKYYRLYRDDHEAHGLDDQ